MINLLIEFSIKNKLLIALLTLLLIVAGIWSMTRVPLDAVPDITNNQVQVITQAANLGTQDIEQFVTYPVELAMANLPGVVEIRSISRFGLSVVTIVFEDDMGSYLPRQLVGEQLVKVGKEIPEGFGQPFMGPITTGLGEIYQYSLKVDTAYKDQYTLMDLRSIQNWIIERQMAMVPGVVEINAVGGESKQYEVALRTNDLNAMGITIVEVYNALEANNQNTGGAYIERDHKANFVRGEGLARNVKDIENIVVKTVNGIPIHIKDIAKVQFGAAIRYGALTQNGQGEVVGGLIMMLKGSNSNDVIKNVKVRINEIQKSLPEGVTIEPFLERSKLISQTTSTVRTNLLEGALIVIFVLVILLGNWRGGLIVASTIPLSLLFAFILMNVFDVWANLMSLGAIDFGIIIDGAVIIVEGTVFLLHDRFQKKATSHAIVTPKVRQEIAIEASGKMMNSAFFGQLIIIIVFIPILALEGVEGKMFKPMALTFMFAMIGVILLCLTYVPMMSAWFLKIGNNGKKSLGDRMITRIENNYQQLLTSALKRGRIYIGFAFLLLMFSTGLFYRMGAEFIPELDEGDLAFHAILKPGSSLSETIATTTRIEQMVMETFPEVRKIVSRIGVAEVPTDPMPMDLADIIVILKPKEEWVSASSKEELVEKMKSVVTKIPGVNYEFTQPIEMRFNELLEGVREDIAIKLYGDDVDVLASKANEVAAIIAGTAGIGDMKVEATTGLPQITVTYKRYKLAQYGLNVSTLNMILQSSFAGSSAGLIFENEKRFDLVVRLAKEDRASIESLKNLYVNVPNSAQIPLREIAEISYQSGPMQISRDNTNRRTYVGVNVRGRDVKSLVEEIKAKLDDQLVLPPGYFIRYGGAFENLQRATQKLKVLVPIVLALIFVFIFFALKSFQQSMMIYMAIPLAAIGGIISLWLRDMPFSISAGIGFIVLFGVAVLNGLVLVGGWNELKEHDKYSLEKRILLGAKRRIRPILLTAMTDILGFLPMAMSKSAGAEVQRPLATVVIGGMISATLLTLFILPILYKWSESPSRIRFSKLPTSLGVLLFVLFLSPIVKAQEAMPIRTLEEAIETALSNNKKIKISKAQIQTSEIAKKESFNPYKTNVSFQYGQYNSFENDFSVQVTQRFDFPTVYVNRKLLNRAKTRRARQGVEVSENELKRDIKASWYELCFLHEKLALQKRQDSLYQRYLYATKIRFEAEATSYLEKVSAETKVMELQNKLFLTKADISIITRQLDVLLGGTVKYIYSPAKFIEMPLLYDEDTMIVTNSPMLGLRVTAIQIAKAKSKLEVSKMFPEFNVGYFNQSLTGSRLMNGDFAGATTRFSGVKFSVSLPLFFSAYRASIKKARMEAQIAETQRDYFQEILQSEFSKQLEIVKKFQRSLNYYNSKAVPQANLIISEAEKYYQNEAVDYIEYFQQLNQGLDIHFQFLDTVNEYNQAVVYLEYLIGN